MSRWQTFLPGDRGGVSFAVCVFQCANDGEFVREYDRLNGTNLSLQGTPVEHAVDLASGRIEGELSGFVDFCWDVVFLRFGK